jgi:hypothetical protein
MTSTHAKSNHEGQTLTNKCKAFDELLLASIDEALISLGESVKQSIYFHMESEFSVPRRDIPSNLDQFQTGLEKIFGAGARFIEILIMKKLHTKIGQPIEIEKEFSLEFVEYVNVVEHNFLKE